MDDLHDFNFSDMLITGGFVGLALALEHVGMWPLTRHLDPADELTPLFPYIVGTGTIGVGITILARKWRDPRLFAAYWTIVLMGGGVVGGLRLYRKWLRLEAEFHRENGHIAGHVAGVGSYIHGYEGRRTAERVA